MNLTFLATVEHIFNSTKSHHDIFVRLPNSDELVNIVEYCKLPSYDRISHRINDIVALEGKVVIILK